MPPLGLFAVELNDEARHGRGGDVPGPGGGEVRQEQLVWGQVDEEVVQIVDGLGDGGDPGGLKGELPQRPLPEADRVVDGLQSLKDRS